jgi:hypothetical protein
MKKLCICLLITCGVLKLVNAQQIHGVIGADVAILGNASVTASSVFSVVNNPAQVAMSKHWQAGIYSSQRFGQKELTLSNISFIVPTKAVSFGFGINHYGFSTFNQQRFVVSVGKKLSETVALGVQLNYAQTTIVDYGNAGAFVLGMGITYKPITKLQLGFMVYNPTQQKMSNLVSDKIPSYARLGLNYQVNEKVHVLTETEQQLTQQTILRAGIRYQLNPKFILGMGLSTQPVCFTFGATVKVNKLAIDVAAGIHQVLGILPQVSLRLPLEKLD